MLKETFLLQYQEKIKFWKPFIKFLHNQKILVGFSGCALIGMFSQWRHLLQVDETDVEPKDIELVMQQANVSKPKVRDAVKMMVSICM